VDGVGLTLKKSHLASKLHRLPPFFSIMIKNTAFSKFCQKRGNKNILIILNVYGRHYDLVNRYRISVSQMTMDMSHLS